MVECGAEGPADGQSGAAERPGDTRESWGVTATAGGLGPCPVTVTPGLLHWGPGGMGLVRQRLEVPQRQETKLRAAQHVLVFLEDSNN